MRAWPPVLLLLIGCTHKEPHVCATGEADFRTLAEAAEKAPPGPPVVMCPGVYHERLVLDRSLHLRGADANTTIIDAGGAGSGILIRGGHELVIEDLTLRGGDADDGGAIRCVGSRLEVRGSLIVDNRASNGGGGVFAEDCTVEIEDSLFEGNQADDGGALMLVGGDVVVRDVYLGYNSADGHGGAIYLESDALIEDSVMTDNESGWTGGGVYIYEHAPVLRGNTIAEGSAFEEGGGLYLHRSQAVLEDNLIRDNNAGDDGGGIRIFESKPRLERNSIVGNQAGGDGGGVKISHLPAEFLDNRITDNVAGGAGGGLELDNDASVVRGGVIANNRAGRGGGIHAMLWPWNDGVIEDVRIADNHAWRGGGLALEANYQPVVLRRLTLEGNIADEGGGLYAWGTELTLANSLIAHNQAYDEGGGLYLAPAETWHDDCPCPPADPLVDVEFLVVHGNEADTGAALWTAAPNLSFESSILSGHEGAAVTAVSGRVPAWRYNDTYPASFAGMADPTGTLGNLATEPRFVSPPGGDFRLHHASECIDAGNPALRDPDGSRADMGLHAGPGAP